MPELGDLVPHFPNVTQLAIPLFVGLILLELLVIRRFGWKGDFETKDTTTSLMMGVGNVVSGLVFGFVAFGVLMWVWQFRLTDFGISVWVILACFHPR